MFIHLPSQQQNKTACIIDYSKLQVLQESPTLDLLLLS